MLNWIGKRFGSEGRVFPLGVGGRLLLLFLAMLIGTSLYQSVSDRFHDNYREAFANAQVISTFLSAYPDSPQLAKPGSLAGQSEVAAEKQDSAGEGSIWRGVYSLTPGDLVTLMVEAGIAEEGDFARPVDILDLRSGGAAAWLATAIVSTDIVEDYTLARTWVGGEIACASDSTKKPVSSVEGLVFLYRSMGSDGNGFGSDDGGGDCVAEVPDAVRLPARRITEMVIGDHPSFFFVGEPKPAMEPYAAIKQAMAGPWGFFDLASFGQPDPAENPAGGHQLHLMSFVEPVAGQGFYQQSTDCDDGCEVTLSDLRWFKDDPAQREAALVKLSNLIVDNIMSSDDVKLNRFLYQAWRGWIQWVIIVIFCYVALQMVWRVVAAILNRDRPEKGAFFPPVVTIGSVNDWEDAVFQSRRFVDQWINTLPLLGLLGTVVGILFGLPEASAAINAKGPTAAASVTQLFEQLGLAFGTTALAVLAVVILQVLWEVIQYYEDKFLANRNA
ncbi:MotA/TolQ/ExbB proton channel family protein [Marinobacter segnicrescens]|uniref:MotA/TolQ/ExbB proton channel family protein n=1 Tax=Marinobacter segnicrescens TaxID=430453 RepID=UPI003A922192